MFKMNQSGTYFWPVKFQLPSESKPGQFEQHSFQAEFKRVTEDELKALQTKVRDTGDVLPIILEVTKGWREVTDDQGQPVPFSGTMLEQLCKQFMEAQVAIMESFMAANDGGVARRKN